MRIVITGGCGFLGRRVALKLVRTDVEGSAASWSPLPHVELSPGVQFGEPVVAGTRLLTSTLAEAAERYAVEDTAARLGVKLTAARAAVEFERQLAAVRS